MASDPPHDAGIDWRAIRDRIDGMMQFTPHARALGLRITDVSQGKAKGRAPYREDLVGDPDTGVIAGGVIIAFLDHLSGVAAMTSLGAMTPIATLDLRIDYMRAAAPGRDVLAEAHCYKVTRSVAFVRAVAFEDSPDDPVANAVGAFMVNTVAVAGLNLQK